MTLTQGGSTVLTRWYSGSRYIKESAGGVTKEYTWIGGDAHAAPVVAVKQGTTVTYYYLLRDHLGTVTHVTDTQGNVVSEYSFDAWGRRRDKDDWGYTLSGEPDLFAGCGFTGHEYLPWFNLWNMNGRLYDPAVGRFLSPDPYIQDPLATQEYNRYSYCLNNPLKFTDPSGYKKQAVEENTFDWAYAFYLNRRFSGGGTAYSGYLEGTYGNWGNSGFLNYQIKTNGSRFQTIQHYRLQFAYAGMGNDKQLNDIRFVPSYTETIWIGNVATNSGGGDWKHKSYCI
jgi:RHS repeat-associated protein